MRCRQLTRDLSGPASQFRFGRLSTLFFPIPNFDFYLFKMRSPRIDLLQHFESSRVILKPGQCRDIRFLAHQSFKFLLLTRCFVIRPVACSVACNGFNPPNASCNRLFFYDSKWPDIARRSHVRPTTKFHRVTVRAHGALRQSAKPGRRRRISPRRIG